MLSGGFNNQAVAEQLIHYIKAPPPAVRTPAGQEKDTAVKPAEGKAESGGVEWFTQVEPVDVTTVSLHPEEIAAPRFLNIFGYKVDLSAKVADLKDNYVKNYALGRSHNLMVARFAQFKTASLGALLSMLGVPQEELENLQRKAVRDAVRQNKILFEENEYNRELLGIIGASKKRMQGQNKVLNEIQNQLVVQAANLGMDGYYSRERILEIRLEQCRRILEKFLEERTNLEYQHQCLSFGVN
jgi:hypothetical protein